MISLSIKVSHALVLIGKKNGRSCCRSVRIEMDVGDIGDTEARQGSYISVNAQRSLGFMGMTLTLWAQGHK